MAINALIGSTLKLKWRFVSRVDGVTPVDVVNPTLKVWDSYKVQVGSTVLLQPINHVATGEYEYHYVVPNVVPYIDIELSAMNGSQLETSRERVNTEWFQEKTSSAVVSPLVVYENTYITMEEANTYMGNKFNSDIWFATSEQDRTKAIIQATKSIDTLPLKGDRMNFNQPLAFPRLFSSWGSAEDRLLNGPVTSPLLPTKLKDATCEEAFAILQDQANPDVRLQLMGLGIKSIKSGDASETYGVSPTRSSNLLSTIAYKYMRQFIANSIDIERSR